MLVHGVISGIQGTRERFNMIERRKYSRRKCDLCSCHSGIVATQKHHETMLRILSKRLWSIIFMLVANLLLIVSKMIIKSL